MTCKQSEIFMMEHFEKTISPKNAKELAQHVLSCASCRTLYLMFDEVAEFAAEEIVAAPEGFTSAVMTSVRAEATETVKAKAPDMQVFMQILWGLSAIFMGVGSYFIFNPDVLAGLATTHPIVDGFVHAAGVVGTFFSSGAQWFMHMEVSAVSGLSAVALFFVVMLGAVLTVLYRDEQRGGAVKA